MKSIGDQVREFRLGQKPPWTTAKMATKVGKKRQHIEQLEEAGNRQPRYLGTLAGVMGTTVDEMLELAGLKPRGNRASVARAIRDEQDLNPYELIERGLKALVIVGEEKDAVLEKIRELARKSEATREAWQEQMNQLAAGQTRQRK